MWRRRGHCDCTPEHGGGSGNAKAAGETTPIDTATVYERRALGICVPKYCMKKMTPSVQKLGRRGFFQRDVDPTVTFKDF